MNIDIPRITRKMAVISLSHAETSDSDTADFVRSHWYLLASFFYAKSTEYGMKGAVVLDAHQPNREMEDTLVINGEAIGIDFEIPSGFADLADRTGVDVRDILDSISECDPEHEVVVVLIYRDGRAEFGTYAFMPAPPSVIAPKPSRRSSRINDTKGPAGYPAGPFRRWPVCVRRYMGGD